MLMLTAHAAKAVCVLRTVGICVAPPVPRQHNSDIVWHVLYCCCVCRVVPACYRRCFPAHLKSHRSHDIVLLCVDCHQVLVDAAKLTSYMTVMAVILASCIAFVIVIWHIGWSMTL